jgi:hypothetical protein
MTCTCKSIFNIPRKCHVHERIFFFPK